MGEPWGASVDGAAALVPEATIPDTLQPGQRGVTRAQVEQWVTDLCQRVLVRLAGWERIRDDARRAAVQAAARDLVHQGVASYIEGARHPERAGLSETSYAAVLWRRFTEGLEELAAQVAEWLADPDDATPDADVEAASAPAWCFPAPVFTDDLRF
ncbi:hypothetical protein LI90_4376 (plasmid) [Carbonactinospora thermoautotrophica]|uniref:Uncharacterized protein n=1 Tax=Carbonactinospora thermoautotrophica TaxID=1469144 RepID=A0A132MHU1_9ACTN|nr:hypothetical protein LI90_4376 [Carbonactinospora thermoautotrophica]